MGNGHMPAVVGDGHVLIAARLGGGRHLGNGRGPVAPIRVRMQITANVVEFHELGELMLAREGDLAAILAQLRRHEGKAELLVDLGFGPAGDAAAAFEEPVLVELPAAIVRQAAQGDVVRFGAGEIQQRRPEARRRNDAQVDLQTRAQDDGRARRPVCRDLGDVVVLDETVADGRGLSRYRHDVEIADGLAPPPVASRHRDVALGELQIVEQRRCLGLGHRQLEAFLRHRRLGQGGEDLLLRLGSETAQLA